MRDRLIELLKTPVIEQCISLDMNWEQFTEAVYSRIADNLLANGVIVPPCKVGDTVYMPWEFDDNKGIAILEVIGISLHYEHGFIKTDLFSDCDEFLSRYNYGRFGFTEIGKTVFLTKEEAEQALKECEQSD